MLSLVILHDHMHRWNNSIIYVEWFLIKKKFLYNLSLRMICLYLIKSVETGGTMCDMPGSIKELSYFSTKLKWATFSTRCGWKTPSCTVRDCVTDYSWCSK